MTGLVLLVACRHGGESTGSVWGTVVLEDEAAAEGALVNVGGLSDVVDAEGGFDLDEVPVGEHTLTVLLDDYAPLVQALDVGAGTGTPLELALTPLEEDVNHEPFVSSLSLAPPQLLPSGTAAALATASDPDGDALTFTWTVDNGFEVAPGMDPGTAVLTAPGTEGTTATLTVEVSDPDGAIGAASIYVSTTEAASNRPPAISALSLAPPQLPSLGEGTARVSAADPDGDALTYEWTVDGGFSVTADDAVATVTAPDADDAEGTLTVVVSDGLGLEATASIVVTTSSNRPPSIASLSMAPPALRPEAVGAARVTATDPDGDALTVTWTATGGFEATSTGDDTADVTAPDAFGAEGELTVEVSDGVDSVLATILVSTVASQPPVISALSIAPPQLAPLGTADALASAADPDGGTLTWSWSATGGFTVTGTGATATVTAPDEHDAEGTITATATDPEGDTASATLAVTTSSNGGPVIAALSVAPSVLQASGTASALVAASDPEGDALTYTWGGTGGFTASGTTASATITAPSTPATSGTVTVTVADGPRQAQAAAVVSTAANRAPVLGSVSVSPPVLTPSGTASILAAATDPDGQSVTWTWAATGGFQVAATTPGAATITAPSTNGTSGTVTATASDGTASVSATVLVRTESLSNDAPVLGSFSVSPPVLAPSGTAAVLATATDPNDDALTWDFQATGGFSVAEGTNGTATLTAPSGHGSSGTVTVTVSDGAETATAQVLVRTTEDTNAAPHLHSLTASPPIVLKGTTTTLAASAADPDGDPLEYQWTLPAGWSSANTEGASITVTAPGQPNRNDVVSVTVRDELGGESTGSLVVSTWPNRGPAIASLTASPSEPLPFEQVLLHVNASDPDGDSLSYAWSNDASWAMTGTTGSRLMTAGASPGQTALVQVVVTDGFGGTATGVVAVRTEGCAEGRIEVGGACVRCGGEAVVDNAPIAFWRLGGTTGGATDAMGSYPGTYGTTGVTRGVGTATWDGDLGASFSDDVNSGVRVNAFGLSGGAYGVSLWLKTTDSGSGIVSYASSSSFEDVLIYRPEALTVFADGASVATNLAVNDGVWHHLAVTWRAAGGDVVVWVDGIQRFTGTAAANGALASGGVLYLGQEQDALGGGLEASQAFSGSMDDVAVFARFLTNTDVQELFQGGVCEACDGVDNDGNGVTDDMVKGLSAQCPARSCLELHQDTARSTGTAWIDPFLGTPGDARLVTCDMTTSGGGWLVLTESTNYAYVTVTEGDSAQPYVYGVPASFVTEYKALSREGFQDWVCRTVGVNRDTYQSNWVVWHDGTTSQFAQCQAPDNSSEMNASGTWTTLSQLPAREWHPEDCGDSSERCQHNVGDLWLR